MRARGGLDTRGTLGLFGTCQKETTVRSDMKYVVIERPRRGGGGKFPRAAGTRRAGDDYENFQRQEGMRRPHRDQKELSDFLSPLERYLWKQVGRPWDKVWSEICRSGMDGRSVLGRHVLSHVWGFVERHVRIIDGKPYYLWVNEWAPLASQHRARLYIDPRDGLLKKTRLRRGGTNR